jgi:hypothetical protein
VNPSLIAETESSSIADLGMTCTARTRGERGAIPKPTGIPGRSPYRDIVRPVTSIAIAVVLAFIVTAFVVKLLTGGLTP